MYSFPPSRFKVHRADLSLLETVSRTLTSAQVKLKSEVAASNGQSKTISDHISKLKRLVDQKVSLCSDLHHFLHNNYALSLPPHPHITDTITYNYIIVYLFSFTSVTIEFVFIPLTSPPLPLSCTQSTSSSELLSQLPPLSQLLTARVDYLFCRATTLQGSRVGGSTMPSTSSVRPIGSMNVTKSIME